MFQPNQAGWDRAARLLLAVAMVVGGLTASLPAPWNLALQVFAVYPLVTGLLGWDPVYVLAGFRGTRDRASR